MYEVFTRNISKEEDFDVGDIEGFNSVEDAIRIVFEKQKTWCLFTPS